MTGQIWFITGASSGLGRAVTEHVLSIGDVAIATCRKPADLADLSSKFPETQLLVLKLDVTKRDEVKAAFAEVERKLGRIDVVYSNAGWGAMGEIESMPEKVARDQFDCNYFGSVNVANESVRFFREVNKPAGGRLLAVSSMLGISNMQTLGHYGATKFALDGIHESFAKEMDPSWNIKFTVIPSGGFKTRGLTPASLVTCEAHPAYPHHQPIRDALSSGTGQTGDAAKAAQVIHKIANDPNAPLRVPLGMDSVAVLKARAEEMVKEAEYGAKYEADY